MRRIVLVLAVVAGVIFTLGAGAAPASAANCSASSGLAGPDHRPPIWNYWLGKMNNCTDVDQVRFYGYSGYGAVLQDFTQPFTAGTGWINDLVINSNAVYVTVGSAGCIGGCPTQFNAKYQTGCWYNGSASHSYNTTIAYSLHSNSQHSWGPIHNVTSSTSSTMLGC